MYLETLPKKTLFRNNKTVLIDVKQGTKLPEAGP